MGGSRQTQRAHPCFLPALRPHGPAGEGEPSLQLEEALFATPACVAIFPGCPRPSQLARLTLNPTQNRRTRVCHASPPQGLTLEAQWNDLSSLEITRATWAPAAQHLWKRMPVSAEGTNVRPAENLGAGGQGAGPDSCPSPRKPGSPVLRRCPVRTA